MPRRAVFPRREAGGRIRLAWAAAHARATSEQLDAAGTGARRRILVSRYSLTFRNRSAFAITDTELNVIAALAQIGLMSTWKAG